MKNGSRFKEVRKLMLQAYIFSEIYYPFWLYFKGHSDWRLVFIPMMAGVALIAGVVGALIHFFCRYYPIEKNIMNERNNRNCCT